VPAALPKELRRRIIEAWQAGEGTWEQLAARFKVGVATVDRLVALFRATGSIDPRPHGGGHEPQLTTEHLELLRKLVEAQPDMTLEELAVELIAKGGPAVSTATVGRAVREKLGLTRKKSPSSRPSATGRPLSLAARSSSRNSPASRRASSSSSTRAARTSR
jgi:transposase